MANQFDRNGAVVLLSGGIDSTTCLALAVEKYGKDNVKALSFYYGQKHSAEISNARNVANYLGVELVVATVDKQLFSSSDSTLLEGNSDVSHVSYAERIEQLEGEPVDTYVPFRNGLMISQAAALAYSSFEKAEVIYGAHADDAAGSAYPDCSQPFYDSMNTSIMLGTADKVKLSAPFIRSTKYEVIARGVELGVPYELTRSCYEGKEDACGKCGTCIDRINAFKKLGMKDPIEYETNIEWGK